MKDAHWHLCRLLACSADTKLDPHSLVTEKDESFWLDFTELADSNLVTPAVWAALQRTDQKYHPTSDFLSYFRAANEWNLTRNQAIRNELSRAISALNKRSIVPILLKGAAYISDQTYPDIGARILGDLDILVATDDVDAAEDVFESLGYLPAGRPDEAYDRHHHTEPLKNPSCQAFVEIHHEAIAEPITDILPAAMIIRDARQLENTSGRYAVPSPTHAATISFLHSQVIDSCNTTARINIRSLMDMAFLTARYGSAIDWDGILETMRAHGQATPLRNYFYSLEKLAGLDFSAQPAPSLQQRLHFTLIGAALRFGVFDSLMTFLDELSDRRLTQRYNLDQTGESLASARMRHITFVANRVFSRNSDDTS